MDALSNLGRLDFVKQQLAMYTGRKLPGADHVKVICPYHSEKTPSGKVSLGSTAPGWFYCFGCGANKSWDEVAPKLNLEPYRRGPPKEEHALNILMQHSVDGEDEGYEPGKFKFKRLPKDKLWRTIPTNLLLELGGKLCYRWSEQYERYGTTKFIYLPVMVNGVQKGYFLARLKKDQTGELPSYLLAKRKGEHGWSRQQGLWPFDHSIEMMVRLRSRTIILVEGQRDALRLINQGIPAMCIFGTQSWTDMKAELLEVAGVERVVLLFDGDDAGIAATEKIKPSVKKYFDTRVVKLWSIKGSPYIKFRHKKEPSKAAKKAGVELYDPGNMPVWILDKLNARYFQGV